MHGDWQHVSLGPFDGRGDEEGIRDIDVKLILPRASSSDYYLIFGNASGDGRFTTAPDFARTYTLPESTVFVDGCLALAIEEKDPHMRRGREEDMVRVIGLEITTQ